MTKIKTLKPNRNNIETYLPIFSGYYGSRWDEPYFEGEADHYGLPSDFPFWDYLNWHDYKEALNKFFCDCVEVEMRDFIEIVEYQRMHSPKKYNFTNDSIYCIIRPKKQAIADYIYTNKQAFEKYLEDHLKSRDGFISWHSYQFEEWEINTKKFKSWDKDVDSAGFNLGFVLSFIADNEGLEENQVFEESDSHVYVSEFMTEEFYALVDALEGNEFINKDKLIDAKKNGEAVMDLIEQIELIKKFVRENYTSINVKDLTLAHFSEIETGFYDTLEDFIYIEKVINAQISEIESHTLTLELK